MKRYAINELIAWKEQSDRKPLILYGARQVGKTWLVREFGKSYYKKYIEIDFFTNPEYKKIFEKDLDPHRIIKALSSLFKTKITPSDTLIFFDEVQECERAKNSLKYFEDKASEYHIIAAGSYLGVYSTGAFPVGKVSSMNLYPMSFFEFLEATENDLLLESIKNKDYDLIDSLSTTIIDLLKTYFFVGGMPEVLGTYIKYEDLAKVRRKQKELLQNYSSDFSKHLPLEYQTKVQMIWDTIPYHLAKEKKRFIYKEIKSGARARDFETAMNILQQTGLVYKVYKITTSMLPLIRYQEREIFKLYMLDVGLLNAKANIDISTFYLEDNKIFYDYQGALAEQFVLTELKQTHNNDIFYWGKVKSEAEVDFLTQYKNEIIPIEVKSSWNTQSKSLKVYLDKEKPKYAIKISLNKFAKNGNILSIPLYMVSMFREIVEECDGDNIQR